MTIGRIKWPRDHLQRLDLLVGIIHSALCIKQFMPELPLLRLQLTLQVANLKLPLLHTINVREVGNRTAEACHRR